MAGALDNSHIEYHDLIKGKTRKSFQNEQRHKLFAKIFYIVSVSLNIVLIGAGAAYLICYKGFMQSSYERGFASDLVPVRSEIELTKSVYNGEVELKSDGSFFMDPASQQYVSKPSIEVDMAWTRLLDGLNIDIDQSEADLEGKTFKWPESGTYFTGLEVFHSLHCLNRLRQAMYPEYYNDLFSDPNDPPRERHIGHCINHLRQAIQCHADLTPMEWKQVGKKVILNTATQHTCRNFEKIQSWAIKRKTNFDKFKMIQNGSLTIVD